MPCTTLPIARYHKLRLRTFPRHNGALYLIRRFSNLRFFIFVGDSATGEMVHGVSSQALHRIILRKLGGWEMLQKLFNTLNRCRGLIKQFQRGIDSVNFESIINDDSVIDFKSSPIAQSPTHVFIFDQVDSGRSRI